MATEKEKEKKPRSRVKRETPVTVIDQSISIQSVDRSPQTLERWRAAIVSAESVVSPARKLLYDQYQEAILDEHLTSVLAQRRLALGRTRLVFRRNGVDVEPINELIRKRFFRQLLRHVLDSRFWGFSLVETDFVNHRTRLVDRRHVNPSKGVVTQSPYDQTGIPYAEGVYPTWYLPVGEIDDLGLLVSAVPLVLVKRGDVLDWATFNELYGQPLRKGTYNPLDPTLRKQLETALKEMGSAAYITLPEGTNVELVESGQKAGAKDTFHGLADFCDKGLSKLIVGQTMTTQDGSSKSQGEVHERVRDDIVLDDQAHVLSYLNEHVVEMMVAQGIGDAANGTFEFLEEEKKDTPNERFNKYLAIHKNVGKITKKWWTENYGAEFANKSDDELDEDPEDEDPEDEDPEPETPAKPKKKRKKQAKLSQQESDLISRVIRFFRIAPTR